MQACASPQAQPRTLHPPPPCADGVSPLQPPPAGGLRRSGRERRLPAHLANHEASGNACTHVRVFTCVPACWLLPVHAGCVLWAPCILSHMRPCPLPCTSQADANRALDNAIYDQALHDIQRHVLALKPTAHWHDYGLPEPARRLRPRRRQQGQVDGGRSWQRPAARRLSYPCMCTGHPHWLWVVSCARRANVWDSMSCACPVACRVDDGYCMCGWLRAVMLCAQYTNTVHVCAVTWCRRARVGSLIVHGAMPQQMSGHACPPSALNRHACHLLHVPHVGMLPCAPRTVASPLVVRCMHWWRPWCVLVHALACTGAGLGVCRCSPWRVTVQQFAGTGAGLGVMRDLPTPDGACRAVLRPMHPRRLAVLCERRARSLLACQISICLLLCVEMHARITLAMIRGGDSPLGRMSVTIRPISSA